MEFPTWDLVPYRALFVVREKKKKRDFNQTEKKSFIQNET
jgi:hypothetical protein